MNSGKSKWPENVTVDGDPLNNSNRRYMLKIFPKNSAQIKKEILVIMLNPSTADENKPDQTCEYLIKLCDYNGYNSLTICNLFPLRGNIKKLNEEIGNANDLSNDQKLYGCIAQFDEILCAWGQADKIKIKDRKAYNKRIREVYIKLTNKKLREFGHSTFKGYKYPHHPRYTYIKSKESVIVEHKPDSKFYLGNV